MCTIVLRVMHSSYNVVRIDRRNLSAESPQGCTVFMQCNKELDTLLLVKLMLSKST